MLNHPFIDNETTLCPTPFLYQITFRNSSIKLCLLLSSLLLIPLHFCSNISTTTLSITSLEETSILSLKPFNSASTSISSSENQSTSRLSSRSPPWPDPPLISLSTSLMRSSLMSSNYSSVSCTTQSTYNIYNLSMGQWFEVQMCTGIWQFPEMYALTKREIEKIQIKEMNNPVANKMLQAYTIQQDEWYHHEEDSE